MEKVGEVGESCTSSASSTSSSNSTSTTNSISSTSPASTTSTTSAIHSFSVGVRALVVRTATTLDRHARLLVTYIYYYMFSCFTACLLLVCTKKTKNQLDVPFRTVSRGFPGFPGVLS